MKYEVWRRFVVFEVFSLALLGVLGAQQPTVAEDGPYAPGSFRALLAARVQTEPNASPASVAQAIAEEQASSGVGADAVGFVGTEAQWTPAISEWLTKFAEAHADTKAGGLACDIVLTHTPQESRKEAASKWANAHNGTNVGLAANACLLRILMDTVQRDQLSGVLAGLLSEYDPESLRQAIPPASLAAALDALGEPRWAARLVTAASDRWAAEVEACGNLLQRIQSGETSGGCVEKLLVDLRELFAADFAGNREKAVQQAAAFAWGTLGLNTAALPAGTGPGDIDNLVGCVVEGVCRRVGSSQTSLSPESKAGFVNIDGLLSPCLALMTGTVGAHPEVAAVYTQAAKSYGDALAAADLATMAEGFYTLAIAHTESPEVRGDAAMALAEIYSQKWQATDTAISLLRDAIDQGASPRTQVMLARLLYQQQDYESVLDVLSRYVEVEKEQAQIDRAYFIMGQALNKLGRHDEKRAVWEEVQARTKDPKLVKALEAGLSVPDK